MTDNLPQIYHEVAKDLIPYTSKQSHQMAMITFDPALPCILCNRPATKAIIVPSPEQSPGSWLTFPICKTCEERQVKKRPAKQK